MNWDAIGAVGEIVGACGVILSLVYLAIQIRQNSNSTKSAAGQSILIMLNEAANIGASSPENARIIIRGQTDFDSLTEDQKLQFALWMISFFRSLDLAFQNYSKGLIEESAWRGYAFQLESFMSSPSVRRVWLARRELFSDDFRTYVEALEPAEHISNVEKALEVVLGEGKNLDT